MLSQFSNDSFRENIFKNRETEKEDIIKGNSALLNVILSWKKRGVHVLEGGGLPSPSDKKYETKSQGKSMRISHFPRFILFYHVKKERVRMKKGKM